MLTFQAIKFRIPETGWVIEKGRNQAEIKEFRSSKPLFSLACARKRFAEIKQLINCPIERHWHHCELVAVITGNYGCAERCPALWMTLDTDRRVRILRPVRAGARAFKGSIYSCLKARCDAIRAREGLLIRGLGRHLFHLLTGASNSLLTAFPEVPGPRNYRPRAFLGFLHSHGLDPHPVHKPSSRRCCVLANAGEMLLQIASSAGSLLAMRPSSASIQLASAVLGSERLCFVAGLEEAVCPAHHPGPFSRSPPFGDTGQLHRNWLLHSEGPTEGRCIHRIHQLLLECR